MIIPLSYQQKKKKTNKSNINQQQSFGDIPLQRKKKTGGVLHWKLFAHVMCIQLKQGVYTVK